MNQIHVPKVTIGLPVRNGGRYLALALDSILAQTFTDFDVIVSDNASTDSTPDIVRQYMARDARVHYIRNDTNVGVAENFNRCFRWSQARYFRWAAYDDVMEPEYLRRCVEMLDADPGVVIAHTFSSRIDEHGQFKSRDEPVPLSQSLKPSDRFFGAARMREVDGVWGLMRSDCIRRTRLHGKYSGSDFAFLADLLLMGRLQYVPEFLFSIREHPAAYTGRGATMSFKEKWEWWGQTGLLKSKYLHAPLLIAYEADALIRSDVEWRERLTCWKYVFGACADYFLSIGRRWTNRMKRVLPSRRSSRRPADKALEQATTSTSR